MIVEGATERECSKQERRKSTQAATKSIVEAATEALLVTCKFMALRMRTANCTVAKAESSTCRNHDGQQQNTDRFWVCIPTSFVKRLIDVATLFGLLISHNTLAPAATKKRAAGTIVRMVSSKSIVKSKARAAETGPNSESELLVEAILQKNNIHKVALRVEVDGRNLMNITIENGAWLYCSRYMLQESWLPELGSRME